MSSTAIFDIVAGAVICVMVVCHTVVEVFKAKYGVKDEKPDKTIDYEH